MQPVGAVGAAVVSTMTKGLIRMPRVAAITGFTLKYAYRLVAEGILPPPVTKIANNAGLYCPHEVRAYAAVHAECAGRPRARKSARRRRRVR